MVEAIALMKIFNGFELLSERALTELNSTAQFYRHAKTGAKLLDRPWGARNRGVNRRCRRG